MSASGSVRSALAGVGQNLRRKAIAVDRRGGPGKSVCAASLREATGLPVVELDKIFWKPGLLPTSRDEWASVEEPFPSGRLFQ